MPEMVMWHIAVARRDHGAVALVSSLVLFSVQMIKMMIVYHGQFD